MLYYVMLCYVMLCLVLFCFVLFCVYHNNTSYIVFQIKIFNSNVYFITPYVSLLNLHIFVNIFLFLVTLNVVELIIEEAMMTSCTSGTYADYWTFSNATLLSSTLSTSFLDFGNLLSEGKHLFNIYIN